MSKVTLQELGLGADDLAAIGKLSEKGLSADQIADAIEKVSQISSTPEEIDEANGFVNTDNPNIKLSYGKTTKALTKAFNAATHTIAIKINGIHDIAIDGTMKVTIKEGGTNHVREVLISGHWDGYSATKQWTAGSVRENTAQPTALECKFAKDATSIYVILGTIASRGTLKVAISDVMTNFIDANPMTMEIVSLANLTGLTTDLTRSDKLVGITSSASEIDGSVDSKERMLIGTDIVDYTNGINLLDASKWIKFISGSNTGTISNSKEFTKFNQNSLVLSQLQIGIASVEGWKTTFTEAQDFSSIDYFTIWVYLDNQPVQDLKSGSDFGSVMLVFGNSSFSNSSAAKINGTDFSWRKGWNNITIPRSSFNLTVAGTLDWTNIGGFQLRIEGTLGSGGCSFYIDSIIAGGEKPNKIPVCITMDDGFEESFEMAEIMNKYGIPTSLFVMNEYVDDQINHPTYFTINDCKKLYNKGNHIGIHGATENEFVVLKEKLLVAKEWLYNNGFTRDGGHLYGSYPNGSYNQATIDYAKSIGIKSLRAINAKNRDDTIGIEAYLHQKGVVPLMNGGIDDLFRIGSTKPLTLAAFTAYLNNAILYKGGLITYHHKFSEFTGKSEWILLAKYLKTKIDDGTIECLTFPQFCKKYSN